ncbi:hypothetical protein [Burkholderia sp. JKS000303]|uniref:hypothetical protein n=1 Tax=Burkholderia sp. JKS000303 TaxID=1938747 RepID=UPI00117CF11A|nr:hypothetical protein [Burkholderia sp. JKS000303]
MLHALMLAMPSNAERAERNFSSVVTIVEVICSAAADHLHQGACRRFFTPSHHQAADVND